MDMEVRNTAQVSQELDEILTLCHVGGAAPAKAHDEKRKALRFRVKWPVYIQVKGKYFIEGAACDISAEGVSVYLNSNALQQKKYIIEISIPPLAAPAGPRIMEVCAKLAYVVYESRKQMFRAAFEFITFHYPADRTYLEERLSKHQMKIPESW